MYNFTKNKIKFSISYTTNFKPSDFLHFNNFRFLKSKNRNKIVAKNFFLFLILLKYNKLNSNNTTSIFVKPNYKKFITLLRAPYRYKLARHQFIFSRYYVLLTIKSNVNTLHIVNVNDLITFIKLLKTFYIWFESNIVYQHQVKLYFNFFINKLFTII